MKKRLATVLAATAVLGVTTAFAANPFSDVTPNDWAYQSVAQLASAGVINGYPDGTFRGQNSITRYEMAQMVAKAMANQSRANAEQQAMINRLADEFSAELNNLGVRVSNLEKKVGNVKVTGDARLRYQGNENKFFNGNSKKSKFDYRGRIQFNATVNDSTDAVVRIATGNNEFGNANNNDVRFDRAFVAHRFGDHVKATVGRYGEFIGGGLMYDDAFDGAKVNFGNDKIDFEAGYGYLVAGGVQAGRYNNNMGLKGLWSDDNGTTTDDNMTATILQLKGKIGGNDHATLGGFYLFGSDNVKEVLGEDTDVYGFNLNTYFGTDNKFFLGGEWLKGTDLDDSEAWSAAAGFGNYNLGKEHSWDIKARYFDQGKHAPIISSTFHQAYDASNTYGEGYKGWMASADYALLKNVGLTVDYGFSGETQDGNDLGDFYRAELNYQF